MHEVGPSFVDKEKNTTLTSFLSQNLLICSLCCLNSDPGGRDVIFIDINPVCNCLDIPPPLCSFI